MNPDVARVWYARWEKQQERYAHGRGERFEVVCDAVEAAVGVPEVVVDLGCGPGSLAAVFVRRFPGCRVIAVDADPFLLALGAAVHPRVRFRQALIGSPDWQRGIGEASVSAIVSSTALHYPAVPVLADIYRDSAQLLRPGGVLVNADHLFADEPRLRRVAAAVGRSAAQRAGAEYAETWSDWWSAAAAVPEFTDLLARRERELPVHGGDNDLTVEHHRTILLSSGFVAAEPVWRCGDSTVLVALTAA